LGGSIFRVNLLIRWLLFGALGPLTVGWLQHSRHGSCFAQISIVDQIKVHVLEGGHLNVNKHVWVLLFDRLSERRKFPGFVEREGEVSLGVSWLGSFKDQALLVVNCEDLS
jgi:hypothetical protein